MVNGTREEVLVVMGSINSKYVMGCKLNVCLAECLVNAVMRFQCILTEPGILNPSKRQCLRSL